MSKRRSGRHGYSQQANAQRQQQAQATTEQKQPAARSYDATLQRLNDIAAAYGGLGVSSVYNAFMRAGFAFSNEPYTQNARVKAINPLPADYTKEELGEFLQNPTTSELPLRKISEGLRWTAYPYGKIIKSYADILTYRYYVKPLYIEGEKAKTEDFLREWRLTDKIAKKFDIEALGHKAAGQAGTQGKVFYITRSSIDRVHNKVNYIFHQQLPSDWCKIIGFNSISGYTVSFDMMYFLQIGTDWTQYGNLFEPYIKDFLSIFEKPEKEKGIGTKFVYASYTQKINVGGKDYSFDPSRVNVQGEGSPEMFQQNGRWCYFVSLPIDRVWTFEIDDTTAIVASPFAGLMQTFAQQADYEAAQLSLVMNPLIKIFTGEIPYDDSDTAKAEDSYKLSITGRALFESYWNSLMAATHTGGTAFFTAPVENIKSHDYPEAAGASTVSSTFLQYGVEKAGLTALIPVTENPHQGVAEYSSKLEARFAQRIYVTLEKMYNHLISTLNLKYEWELCVFGDVYSESQIRADALKQIDKGDTSAYFVLAALDNESVLDKVSMSHTVKASGLLELLQPPQTSYTQSNKSSPKSDTGGAPQKDETEKAEDAREQRVEGVDETNS